MRLDPRFDRLALRYPFTSSTVVDRSHGNGMDSAPMSSRLGLESKAFDSAICSSELAVAVLGIANESWKG